MSLELCKASVFRSGRAILDTADLVCSPGVFTAFCGPNGAGKSTALSVLSGALKPDKGGVHLNDEPMHALSAQELARVRATVAQQSVLSFPFQVHEVVEMGRSPHQGYSSKQQDQQVLARVLEIMGLRPMAERIYTTLSGGEKQRVQIARALAQLWSDEEVDGQGEAEVRTRWLLLDEPTSALDLKHQIKLMTLLKSLAARGWGVIAVLHDLHLVKQHADHVVLFDRGRVHLTGAPSQALSGETIQQVFDLEDAYDI